MFPESAGLAGWRLRIVLDASICAWLLPDRFAPSDMTCSKQAFARDMSFAELVVRFALASSSRLN